MEPQTDFISVDEIIEIVVNGSEPIEPHRVVSPPISAEKKEFLDAIAQFQRRYTGRSLTWEEIFDVLVSLGYRKVKQPPVNGDSQNPPRSDKSGNEKRS